MKFINGVGIDTIDTHAPQDRKSSNDKNLENYQEEKFLKMLGYALPFDALICNGDRFNLLHPDESSNFGNMIIDDSSGDFIAIDNGINALGEVSDYDDITQDFYHTKLAEIALAVMPKNEVSFNKMAF